VRTFEGFAVAYFAGLALAALATHAPRRRQLTVLASAVAMSAAIVVIAPLASDLLRVWLPHVYLAAGYWLPALLAGAPIHPTRFERWLERTDDFLRPGAIQLPATIVHTIELAYLLCYPLVPIAFAVVWTVGSPADVDRFWVAVLASGFACYVTLPWLVSRPPRLAGGQSWSRNEGQSRGLTPAELNVFVLGRVSHQLNTFPSGHVAVTLAAAGCVASVSVVGGAIVGLVAVAIALGAAAGGYHYVVDVLLGVVVAGVAVAAVFI